MASQQTELFPLDHYGRYPIVTLPNGWEVTNQSTRTKRREAIALVQECDRPSNAPNHH